MQEIIEKIKSQKPKVTVFDNGGTTPDRYTLIVHNAYGDIYASSTNPFDSQGIGTLVGETTNRGVSPSFYVKMARQTKHLGKVVKLETLPEEVLKFINQIQSYD
jgi:hypothetical protein